MAEKGGSNTKKIKCAFTNCVQFALFHLCWVLKKCIILFYLSISTSKISYQKTPKIIPKSDIAKTFYFLTYNIYIWFYFYFRHNITWLIENIMICACCSTWSWVIFFLKFHYKCLKVKDFNNYWTIFTLFNKCN